MARHNLQTRIAMSRQDSPSGFRSGPRMPADRRDRLDRPATAFDLLRAPMPGEEPRDTPEPIFPSLKKRTAEERAQEIVDHLKDMILNPERGDGKTGMNYRDWAKTARKEITKAVREAETSAAFREFMSANRLGGAHGLPAARHASVNFDCYSAAFLFNQREYGPYWGMGATSPAFGLSIAAAAGLLYGGERPG